METSEPTSEKVTLAIIQKDIQALQSTVFELRGMFGAHQASMETRIRKIEDVLSSLDLSGVRSLAKEVAYKDDLFKLQIKIEEMEESIHEMLPMVRLVRWIAATMGALVIGLLYAILTHQISLGK